MMGVYEEEAKQELLNRDDGWEDTKNTGKGKQGHRWWEGKGCTLIRLSCFVVQKSS
jgi:hypothetical protein